jgi:serine/threonine protein phosphatase PrpC
MSNFPTPNDPAIEVALERVIRCQLALNGINVDAAALNRIRQQLPVEGWLDGIVEAGKRDGGGAQVIVDLSIDPVAEPPPATEGTAGAEVVVGAGASSDDDEAGTAVAAANDESVGDDPVVPSPPAEAVPVHKPLFRLLVPNGTAERDYDHVLDLSGEPVVAYRIASIEGLDEIGLAFDPDAIRLHGWPHPGSAKPVPHELAVTLERKDDASIQEAATLSLFINPHPRTLWKQIEPDEALEHRKPHRHSQCDPGPPMVLVASVRGRSHENGGSFREDDFHIGRDASGKWTVVAVSDGAGSAQLSRLGSRIATETCVASLLAALEREAAGVEAALAEAASIEDQGARIDKLEEIGKQLLLEPVGRAAFAANKAIRDKAAELGVEEKSLAATLMFAALRRVGNEVLVASYWIGDGAAALLEPASGLFRLLGEADGGEFSGQTRFLLSHEFSREGAWDSIRKRFRFSVVPAATVLLLMTDGVSDPKFGTDNALRDPARWLSFWNNDLAAQLPLSEPAEDLGSKLEEYLQFWSQGEHDDRTLALVRWS